MLVASLKEKSRRYLRLMREDSVFHRSSLRRALALALTAIALLALAWFGLFVHLDKAKQNVEAGALSDAEILARAYATHLFHALEAVDQLSLFVRHGWEKSGNEFGLEAFSQSGSSPTKAGFHVSLIDENGNLLTSTISAARNVNIVNEPYFAVHRRDPDAGFYIGTARIGNFSMTPVVPFSRRLADTAGNFRGIVLISVVPDYFTSSYDEIALRDEGFVAILSKDKMVRLARVGREIFLPHSNAQVMKAKPAFEPAQKSAVLEGEKWFTDERTRFVAWQGTAGYDMITLVGLERDTVLAPYLAQRAQTIRNALLATFVLALLAAAASYAYLRLAWRKHQFETMQQTYRAATEGGSEGFFIAHPIFDSHGEPLDFQITDCNDRGAALLGRKRGDLIGNTVLGLYHGKPAERAIRLLRQALDARVFEGEADWSELGIEGPRWVHIRISRPATDLAVTIRDISAEKAHVAALEKRGNEDALTGLPNRHWANQYLPQAVAACAANGSVMALLFIDLDGFKVVNDTFGHEAGDEVLRSVGRRLREAIRPHDHLVRIGGDEFLVAIDRIHHQADAAHVAKRILSAFQSPVKTAHGVHFIGTSIGISMFPADGRDADTLLNNADIAMYSVKSAGKHGYRFFDQRFYDQVRARHRKEAELRDALAQRQFVMFYQPRLDIASGKTCSMEALVRWIHPTRGLIEPGEFVPLAEENGLIVQLGEQVINMVCAQIARWTEDRQPLVPISINVSGRQFDESRIDELLSSSIARYRIDPQWIELELTESTVSNDPNAVAQVLGSIRAMGIKLLVDDFGTGYSSLAQLQRLDFDVLKVDRSFTAQLDDAKSGPIFFNAIITMAHALGMRVVAEGVETRGQLRALEAMGCDEIQGYIFSKPLPPARALPAFAG